MPPKLQPYARIPQLNRTILGYSLGSSQVGFDPAAQNGRRLRRFRLHEEGKADCNKGNGSGKRRDGYDGRKWGLPTYLTPKQKEQFCRLLMEAYGLTAQQSESRLYRISLFVKKRFAQDPSAFSIMALKLNNGQEHTGLFVRHANPDGKTPGGIYEATIHYHGTGGKFIIADGSHIAGDIVLKGKVQLFEYSRLEGTGCYKGCTLLGGSVLVNSTATNSVFKDVYGYRSIFYSHSQERLRFADSSFKYSKLHESHDGCLMVHGIKVDRKTYDALTESLLDEWDQVHKAAKMKKRLPEASEERCDAKEGQAKGAAHEGAVIRTAAYAASYVLGWLYAMLGDALGGGQKKDAPAIGGHA